MSKQQFRKKAKFQPPKFLTAKEEFFITLFPTRTIVKAVINSDLKTLKYNLSEMAHQTRALFI